MAISTVEIKICGQKLCAQKECFLTIIIHTPTVESTNFINLKAHGYRRVGALLNT